MIASYRGCTLPNGIATLVEIAHKNEKRRGSRGLDILILTPLGKSPKLTCASLARHTESTVPRSRGTPKAPCPAREARRRHRARRLRGGPRPPNRCWQSEPSATELAAKTGGVQTIGNGTGAMKKVYGKMRGRAMWWISRTLLAVMIAVP